jgi:tetratricopeptide (TPR) repeat protein
MTNHFSELGSIMFSKACDYSTIYPISKDDIKMYYELLNSNDVTFPEKISRRNHLTCCLYYLSKMDNKYKNIFLDKFLKTINIKELEINQENLVFVFNIIEYDKTYLHSPKSHLLFLYQALKLFSNVETNLESFILFKYFRGYIKFCVGEYDNTLKEYMEIISVIADSNINNFYIKYIRLRNDLLKVQLNNRTRLEKSSDSDFKEYCQFLKDLFNEVKSTNIILTLKLGFDLFLEYFEKKKFEECIPLLTEMKKLLKKELLKGATFKNGIDYYLAISSRLGYIGVLLDDKKVINSAIKKIKKTLDMIKFDKSEKLVNMTKSYNFVLAILKISLEKKSEYDMKTLTYDFQKNLLPDLNNKSSSSYLVNNSNRDDIIINFKVVNNMNREISNTAKNILNNCVNELNKKGEHNSIFLTFLVAVHDKVYCNAQSYISDTNENMRKYYKTKICEYGNGALNLIYKYYDSEPLLNTKFAKTLLINIFSAYAHIFIYEKNFDALRKLINTIDDLKKNLKIEETLPAFALVNKIKGDLWFYKKDYNASVLYYEKALELFESKSPKIAPMMFNLAYAYFLTGNKMKAKEYLNRCISEYNSLSMEKDLFGFIPDIESIKEKINSAQKLLEQLS